MNQPASGDSMPTVHATVVHILAEAAARSGNAEALVCGSRRLNYTQYLRCVAGLARELVLLGARGSRVALVCGNSIDLPIAMFAAHAAGAQAVPINPAYTARELAYILEDAAPQVVIHDVDADTVITPLCARLGIAHRVVVGSGARPMDSWKDDASLTLPEPLPASNQPATLQYTGGTTGLPKGVDIAHGQMVVNISQREAALPTTPDDERILCVMPLFHVFAVAMCMHLAVYCRGTLVIMPRYRAEDLLRLIETERITRLPAGPTVFIGLLAHEAFGRTDFSTLRSAYSGSAPLPEDVMRRWRDATGIAILEGFGQTEAGPVLTYMREAEENRVGTVGRALPLTEIQIVDTETGECVLKVGEVGEIRARGPQIMSGYRNRKVETAQTLREGWLYTGDIGKLDADGHLIICDRKKDMVIVGGYNVYPREVESVLYSHPDVREAAAIGVPDSYYGETIRAYVVPEPGSRASPDALLDYCRLQLARYKVPSEVVFVSELPRTSVGKVDRKLLRERAAGEAA